MIARRAFLPVSAALLLAAAIAVPAAGAAERATVSATTPAYVGEAARVGSPPADERIGFDVVLGLEDPAGAAALARSVSGPRSDSFRQFVSAAEFRRRFSRSRAQVRLVAGWLRGVGLQVGRPTRNRALLPATGTVAEFERAFGAELATYRASGRRLIAPSRDVSVPARLSGRVLGTIGIPEVPVDSAVSAPAPVPAGPPLPNGRRATTDPGPPPLGFRGIIQQQAPPPYCSPYWAAHVVDELPLAYGRQQPSAICGYAAKQIRAAYGVESLRKRKGIDGSGVDIGIVTSYLSPTLQADLDAYSKRNQIPRTKLRITQPSRYTPASEFDYWDAYTEQTLDVQMAHGMAPGARIHYAGPDGLGNALRQVAAFVDEDEVEVISNSYGGPEEGYNSAFIKVAEQVFDQAAAQGITLLYSSGDGGDNTAGTSNPFRSVEYPASSRRVTAVGGTTLAVGPRNQRLWEQAWGESVASLDPSGEWDPVPPGQYSGGSTGGTSRFFEQPSYQRSTVPKSYWNYFGGRARVVPDIGLIGDPMSGPMMFQTAATEGGETVVTKHNVGGTSVAAPVFAGAVATMVQKNGGRLGFLNPSLYRLGHRSLRRVGPASSPAVSAQLSYTNFLDAGDGYTATLITGGSYNTLRVRPGYDDVTGLGSPLVPRLARRLADVSP